jgi:hypothetical protein
MLRLPCLDYYDCRLPTEELMASRIDLTGWWYAERDSALYFLRHLDDNTIFWMGMRSWWGFRPGTEFTNVFHGTFDPARNIISGAWADVPRGIGPLQSGRVSIQVTQTAQQRQALPTAERPLRRRPGGPGDGNGDGPPPTSDFRLTVIPQGTTGPFPNQAFTKTAIIYDVSVYPDFIKFVFDRITRGGGEHPLSDELKPAKDNVVVFGHVAVESHYGIGWDQSKPREYCLLVRGVVPDVDGDISFNFALNPDERRELDTQPDFWVQSSGWATPPPPISLPPGLPPTGYRGADDILRRLNIASAFHAEIVMFGREEDEDQCPDSKPSGLVPGWAEINENSVTVNGLPVNCNAFFQPGQPIQFVLDSPESGRIDVFLADSLQARISGVITIDTGHSEDEHPTRQLELHPVYAIDVLQDFTKPRPFANLTGVWDSHDGATYYIRQLDDTTLIWLGMSSDHGFTYSNVFSGRIEGNLVRGNWADVPAARGGRRGNGQLTLMLGPDGALATTLTAIERTGGFAASIWRKLYDRPFRTGAAGNTAFPGNFHQ